LHSRCMTDTERSHIAPLLCSSRPHRANT
jgi:hypothetical protein